LIHYNFFGRCKKNYKWWSDPVIRKIWLDPILEFFAKNIYVVRITSSELFIPELVNRYFLQKVKVLDQAKFF
jgi:hypothetical protein